MYRIIPAIICARLILDASFSDNFVERFNNYKLGLVDDVIRITKLCFLCTRLLMTVALSTLKMISPMVMISIDIIQGRQQIIYSYPFFVPILVYTLFMQVPIDYGTH